MFPCLLFLSYINAIIYFTLYIISHGTRITRYILGLETTTQSANCITCLKDADGISHHSDAEILKVAKSHYERLYNSNASQENDIDLF